eukprot:TRINITY_DN21_c0_g1_i1.p1 TRINITY_DN21_c0_g1~~TRINITY_DN21_c0_g1_i1.p1  ORF type:complete len:476 (-),score=123.99 TRINITY_DN21_c0_g1_i1:294-1721(-)
MEETGEFHDWEMLQTSDTALVSASSDSVDNSRDFEGIDGDSDGVIRSDYFALDSEKRYSKKMVLEDDREEGSVDSDKPSWVDPCSESRYGDGAKMEVGFEGIGLRRNNSSEFWSDSGSDRSVPPKVGSFDGLGDGDDVKKEVGFEGIREIEGVEVEQWNHSEFWLDSGGSRAVSSKSRDFEGKREFGYVDDGKREVGFEGIREIEGVEVEQWNHSEFWLDSGGSRAVSSKSRDFEGKREFGYVDDGKREVGFEGIRKIEAEHENHSMFWSESGGDGVISLKSSNFEGKGELGYVDDGKREVSFEGTEVECKKPGEFLPDSSRYGLVPEGESGSDDFPKIGEDGPEFTSEVEIGNGSESGGVVEVEKSGGGEKRNVVWWKLPLELLKFCVYRVSPVWSVSIAAAVMGFVILGRRLYKMRRKSRSVPFKVNLDDKKASQFRIHAARLNEAFSVVRRVPIVRPLPAGGVTPWPVMALR